MKVEPSGPDESVVSTQSGSAVSNSSGVKSRPPLKKLTIPLKALPSRAPHHKVLPGKQPISTAITDKGYHSKVGQQTTSEYCNSKCGSCFVTSLSDSIPAVDNHLVRVLLKSCLHNLVYAMCTYKFYSQGNDEGINHEYGTSVSLFCYCNLSFYSDNDKIDL